MTGNPKITGSANVEAVVVKSSQSAVLKTPRGRLRSPVLKRKAGWRDGSYRATISNHRLLEMKVSASSLTGKDLSEMMNESLMPSLRMILLIFRKSLIERKKKMTQTMKRELRLKFEEVLPEETPNKQVLASALAEAALTVAGLQNRSFTIDFGYFKRNKKAFSDILWNERRSGTQINKTYVNNVVDEIVNEIEGAMRRIFKDYESAHEFPKECLDIVGRLEKGLGSILPRDPEAVKVYLWIIEREAEGQKIEHFTKWARDEARVQFIGKYRYDATKIQAEWGQAFLTIPSIPQQKWSLT